MTNSNPKLDTEDHAWRAFRFLANEMSAEETAEFEAALEDDADLCESLVEACALSESVYAVFEAESAQLPTLTKSDIGQHEIGQHEIGQHEIGQHEIGQHKAPALRRSSIWVSQIACVVALVGAGVAFWFSNDGLVDNLVGQYSQTQASELVERWESASEVDDSREFMVIVESDLEFSSDLDVVIEEVGGDQIPEWLLVALASEQELAAE